MAAYAEYYCSYGSSKHDCKLENGGNLANGEYLVGPVAEVNGVSYATLAEAIDAAQDGETVKLLENITEANAFRFLRMPDITLNLNGQVLMVTNGDALLNNGVLTILDSLTGGKIISENSGGDWSWQLDPSYHNSIWYF